MKLLTRQQNNKAPPRRGKTEAERNRRRDQQNTNPNFLTMKIFNRTYLPEKINYNGKTLKPVIPASATITNDREAEKEILKLKAEGKTAAVVKVLQTRLKGVRDLRGNLYRPSIFIFSN